ncbi:hypothetical protein D3C85_1275600 [compost metagenome]
MLLISDHLMSCYDIHVLNNILCNLRLIFPLQDLLLFVRHYNNGDNWKAQLRILHFVQKYLQKLERVRRLNQYKSFSLFSFNVICWKFRALFLEILFRENSNVG